MTENLAGRGEGLAGLVAELESMTFLKAAWHCPQCRTHGENEIRDFVGRWKAALEAAAPPSTPRNRSYLEDLKHDLRDESYAYEYLLACAQDSTEALRIGVRDVLAALATASDNLSAAELAIKHCREQINALDKLEGATEYEKGDFAGQIDAYAQVGEILHDLIHVKSVAALATPGKCAVIITKEGDRCTREEGHAGPHELDLTSPAATQQPAGSGANDVIKAAQDYVNEGMRYGFRTNGIPNTYWSNLCIAVEKFGSPRKVGEDAPAGDEHRLLESDLVGWWGRCSCGWDCEFAGDWTKHLKSLRPSSVPVGEQKQEEGVVCINRKGIGEAMTDKLLHPGLGSGALREALADLIKMHDERRLVSVAEANLRVDKAREALSLSSPIEPQPDYPGCTVNELALELKRAVMVLCETRKHTGARPCKFCTGMHLWRLYQGVNEPVLRTCHCGSPAEPHLESVHVVDARPTAQASSEVREALELMVKEWHWYAGKHGLGPARLQYALGVGERAVAPSRQGAGSKKS